MDDKGFNTGEWLVDMGKQGCLWLFFIIGIVGIVLYIAS